MEKDYIWVNRKILDLQSYKEGKTFLVKHYFLIKANLEDKVVNNKVIEKESVELPKWIICRDLHMDFNTIKIILRRLKSFKEITYKINKDKVLVTICNFDELVRKDIGGCDE